MSFKVKSFAYRRRYKLKKSYKIPDFNKKFEEVKIEINEQINIIVDKVSKVSPLFLMNFLSLNSFKSMVNKLSEISYSSEENLTIRAVEYIQSILVSTENKCKNVNNDYSVECDEILEETIELYNKIYRFTMLNALSERNVNIEMSDYIFQSQLASIVRGKRYQVFEIEHHEDLFLSHNEIFKELFGIESTQFIDGLKKLQYSLSQGKVDSGNKLKESFDKFMKLNPNFDIDSPLAVDGFDDSVEEYYKFFGNDLNDVKKVTDWPDKLIDVLSYELNQDRDFFSTAYSGWPTMNLPVQKKPFIKIKEISYCFDYYNFFDNIYRVIQKTIKDLKPSYVTEWSHVQQVASEQMIEKLFQKILPEAKIYRDNYYPKNNSLKEMNENDIIVLFENVILVIEVKAGSFTYTPALTDCGAHIKSFEALIEKADYQCGRTINYIKSKTNAPIYYKDKSLKTNIIFNENTEIYSFCVTIDAFNEFTAKIEKMNFIKIQQGTIALSSDDLRVYSDYFTSSLRFLHYLKQRKKAAFIEKLELNDELDHLGMYIHHNLYTEYAKENNKYDGAMYVGYREDIDNYYISLNNSHFSYKKPEREIPKNVVKILQFLENSTIENKVFLSDFIFNFSTEALEQIDEKIDYMLVRQKELNKMVPLITFGELRYCLFINQETIPDIGEGYKNDYVDANILYKDLKEYVLLNLFYDKNNKLIDISYKVKDKKNIPFIKYEELMEMGKNTAQQIILKNDVFKGKIGRNAPCPCGSGKKYKKCCIS